MKSTSSFFYGCSHANARAAVEECRRRVPLLAPAQELFSRARNFVTRRKGPWLPPIAGSVDYDVALVSKNNRWDGSRAFRELVFAAFTGACMANFSLLMCVTSPTRRLHSLSRFLLLDCGTASACEITCVLTDCRKIHVPSLVTYAIHLQEMF